MSLKDFGGQLSLSSLIPKRRHESKRGRIARRNARFKEVLRIRLLVEENDPALDNRNFDDEGRWRPRPQVTDYTGWTVVKRVDPPDAPAPVVKPKQLTPAELWDKFIRERNERIAAFSATE